MDYIIYLFVLGIAWKFAKKLLKAVVLTGLAYFVLKILLGF